MSSSGLSSPLSSPPSSEEEGPMLKYLKAAAAAPKRKEREMSAASSTKSSPKRKRSPSPPHEEVLADNPDIAFIVMFRSRFNEAFSTKLGHFGPQDIERGVVDSVPSPQVESLLCALLGLALNRKKPVERGHHGRALEEAISANKTQWPGTWAGRNPLHGAQTFSTMNPQQRLTLLKALIMWSLNSSDAVQAIVKDSYKQSRHDDDLNQPLSVHNWGRDGDKRRYWLIEGRDDTPFRLYRESNPALKHNTWRSVAGSIEELQVVSTKLQDDGTQAARRLSDRITAAIPRFEATEEKRKRREYRLSRKAQFSRPEPGFSMYEGRTRGKRLRYTFSDEEDDLSLSDAAPRRSTRGAASNAPAEDHPTVTASGRTVRSRVGGMYGEILHSGQTTGMDTPASNEYARSIGSDGPGADEDRAPRSSRAAVNGHGGQRVGSDSEEEMDELDDVDSSGNEWDGGDEDDEMDEADEEMDNDSADDDLEPAEPKSLVITLRYKQPHVNGAPMEGVLSSTASNANDQAPNGTADSVRPTTNTATAPIINASPNPIQPVVVAASKDVASRAAAGQANGTQQKPSEPNKAPMVEAAPSPTKVLPTHPPSLAGRPPQPASPGLSGQQQTLPSNIEGSRPQAPYVEPASLGGA